LEAPVTVSDNELLGVVMEEVTGVRMSGITAIWADEYVRTLKQPPKSGSSRRTNLSPGSIRKRIGVLARVVDWHHRRSGSNSDNPLRSMPIGYSQYSKPDAEAIEAKGGVSKIDIHRDRRLHEGEEVRIMAALAGEKNPDRERALKPDPEFALFTDFILNTGVRLSEAYKLRVAAVDVERRILRIDGSKGARGEIKPRNVPVSTALMTKLAGHIGARTTGLVFSFWTGDPAEERRTSHRLSARFRSVFSYASCLDLTEHDLRHEATCRWVTMRSPGGGWLFSETEICKLMGWSDPRMMLRYASLRGEDLSSRLA
jgi:integrase